MSWRWRFAGSFKTYRHSALLLALLAFGSATIQATVVVKMDVEDLTSNSCAIVVGRLLEIQKDWVSDAGAPEGVVVKTTLWIKVERVHKSCPQIQPGEIVPVSRLGGAIGDRGTWIAGAPTFRSGGKLLLFLTETPSGEHIITGFSQGKFRILTGSGGEDDTAVQDSNAATLLLVDPANGQFVDKPIPGRMKLGDLENEIRRHADRPRGSRRPS